MLDGKTGQKIARKTQPERSTENGYAVKEGQPA